jgi:hypothetical protein
MQISATDVIDAFRRDEPRLFIGAASVTVGLVVVGFLLIRRRFDRLLSFFAWFAVLYGERLRLQSSGRDGGSDSLHSPGLGFDTDGRSDGRGLRLPLGAEFGFLHGKKAIEIARKPKGKRYPVAGFPPRALLDLMNGRMESIP